MSDLTGMARDLKPLILSGVIEQSSFTPTYFGGTTAGVTTYTTQIGLYTRIGNVLFFSARIAWTNQTGTGAPLIGGLPYTSDASNQTTGLVFSSNYAFAGNGIIWYMPPGSSSIQLYQLTTAGFANQAIDTAAEVILSGHYFVA